VSNKNIFFDLDGTLIDVGIRLYSLFIELAPENKFSLAEYWEIKRKGIDQASLLGKYLSYSKSQIAAFKRKWLLKIEERERLTQDVPFPKSGLLLRKLAKTHDLYIVTDRQNKDLAIEQIISYGWAGYIEKVLVTKQKTSKSFLIKENVRIAENDVLIGDTGGDILAGKEIGVKTIAVTSGFLNEKALAEYKPDLIIDNVESIYMDSSLLSRQNGFVE
jgi:phosphoglycolate phosphatase